MFRTQKLSSKNTVDASDVADDDYAEIRLNGNPKYISIAQAKILFSGVNAPYIVYTALLSQSNTDAPFPIILTNTLGVDVTFGRYTDGSFSANAPSGTFTIGKTFVYIGGSKSTGVIINVYDVGEDYIDFYSADSNFINTDGILNNTSFEIRVYP